MSAATLALAASGETLVEDTAGVATSFPGFLELLRSVTLMRSAPIVAIDGPAGAGKSTVARRLAARLGFTYVDSGAMYRTVGLAARRGGLDPEDETAMNRLMADLGRLVLRTEGERTRVWLDSEEVSDESGRRRRGMGVARLAFAGRAQGLKGFQRRMGEAGGVVMEATDIGTVIFPDAEFKFFRRLPWRFRGRRRHAEWAEKGGEKRP